VNEEGMGEKEKRGEEGRRKRLMLQLRAKVGQLVRLGRILPCGPGEVTGEAGRFVQGKSVIGWFPCFL
jgi:hypothetical protein